MDEIDRQCRLPDVDAVLELINTGAYDEHLEAILAAAHSRKRARRGVRRPYGVTDQVVMLSDDAIETLARQVRSAENPVVIREVTTTERAI